MQSENELDRLIIHHLTQDATVMEILTGEPRIYTSHGRDTEEATRTAPAVIIEHTGGPSGASAPIARRGLFLYAYSNRSQAESVRLYEAVRAVLQTNGLRPPLGDDGEPAFELRAYLREASGQIRDWNKEVSAWFTRGTWTAHTFG